MAEGASLLDFLTETLARHLPHLLGLPEELSALPAARRVDFDFLKSEMERLSATVDAVRSELRYAELRARAGVRAHLSLAVEGGRVVACASTDAFERKLGPFCAQAAEALAELRAAHADVQAVFPEVLLYFGESPDSCSLNELVQGAARFVGEVERARGRLEERRAKGQGGALLVAPPAPAAQSQRPKQPPAREDAAAGDERARALERRAVAPLLPLGVVNGPVVAVAPDSVSVGGC